MKLKKNIKNFFMLELIDNHGMRGHMLKSKAAIFRYGACEFMGYLLPMIAISTYDAPHIIHQVYKYRKISLAKEDANQVALNELQKILRYTENITNNTTQIAAIFNELKSHHYYPAPEFYIEWEKEWKLNFLPD